VSAQPQLKDLIRCPKCQSAEIIYSCEPKCCFNHVCADCRSTFEINTQKTGRFDHDSPIEAREPESGDPTTGCAACESLKVAVLSSNQAETLLLCADCRAVLRLAIEEFAPGNF
jgi:DNA-directed RNA polymerase subunit RPC12/RpoP